MNACTALPSHDNQMMPLPCPPYRYRAAFTLTSLWVVLSLAACTAPKPLAATPGPATPSAVIPANTDARYAALPQPLAPPRFNAPTATRTQLENGLSIWHMKHADTPLVAVHLM